MGDPLHCKGPRPGLHVRMINAFKSKRETPKPYRVGLLYTLFEVELRRLELTYRKLISMWVNGQKNI